MTINLANSLTNLLHHEVNQKLSHTPLVLPERDRLKPVPPLANQYQQLTLAPEVYNHLRGLQKKTKDLKSEVKTLRRLAQSQAIAVREDIKDTFMRIRATLLATNGTHWGQNDQERVSSSVKRGGGIHNLLFFFGEYFRHEFPARKKFTNKKSFDSRKIWQISRARWKFCVAKSSIEERA